MAEDRCPRSDSSTNPPFRRNSTIGVCLVFLTFETWIFLYRSKDWDLYIYQRYAHCYRESSLETLYSQHAVEYPPVAVLLMLATDALAERLPDCSTLGRGFREYQRSGPFANFKFVYRLEMAAATLATCWLLVSLVRRCLPHEAATDQWERLLVFALSLGILSHSVFDRLDALLAALMLLALALLLGRRHFVWSFLVLALATAYKVAPAVLVPLWVLGSLPLGALVRRGRGGNWCRLLATAGARGILLAALTLACFLPFYLLAGPRCLAFFTYHRDRGIEYGSTYAALLGVLHRFTHLETTTHASYGSADVRSSLSPSLTLLAPVLTGLLVLGAALFWFRSGQRAAAARPNHSGAPVLLAHACPAEFTAHVLLVLMIFLATNKVFSPQFVLWLTPFVPLVPLAGWPRRLFQVGFLGLCLVTYLLNPHWMSEVLGKRLPTDSMTFTGPSALGVALLVSRTVLLLGLIGGLTAHLVQRFRQSPAWTGR